MCLPQSAGSQPARQKQDRVRSDQTPTDFNNTLKTAVENATSGKAVHLKSLFAG